MVVIAITTITATTAIIFTVFAALATTASVLGEIQKLLYLFIGGWPLSDDFSLESKSLSSKGVVEIHNDYILADFLYNTLKPVSIFIHHGKNGSWKNILGVKFTVTGKNIFSQLQNMLVEIFTISFINRNSKVEWTILLEL